MENLIWQGANHAILAVRKKLEKVQEKSSTRKALNLKKLEKRVEDIIEKRVDGAEAMGKLEGNNSYEKSQSLLKSCEKEFKVNDRSKI